jgi:plasmid maintenance system antidote protein VapI
MEFELLMIRYELIKPKKQTLVRSIGALRKDIANIIELKPYIFLEDAIKLTMMVDRQQKKN